MKNLDLLEDKYNKHILNELLNEKDLLIMLRKILSLDENTLSFLNNHEQLHIKLENIKDNQNLINELKSEIDNYFTVKCCHI